MSDTYVLDEGMARHLKYLIQRLRGTPLTGIPDGPPQFVTGHYCEVLVGEPLASGSGSGSGSGSLPTTCGDDEWWTANVLGWNAETACWTTGEAVWAVELNGGGLIAGTRYLAKIVEHNRVIQGVTKSLVVVFGGTADTQDSGSNTGSGADQCGGIPVSELIKCVGDSLDDRCLVMRNGRLTLLDSDGNVAAQV